MVYAQSMLIQTFFFKLSYARVNFHAGAVACLLQ